MRKYLLLLLIAVFLSEQSFGQNSSNTFKRFGFKVGTNVTNMNFNKGIPPPAAPIQASWKPGFVAGFLLRVPINNNLSIQSEYLYTYVLGQDKSTGVEYKLNYLSMPVLLKYQIANKVALEAGPQFDLLINAKKKAGETSSDITHDTEERNLGITAGLEYKVINDISLSARYLSGVSHIGIGQRSNVKEFKMEQFQLTAVINF
jgi:hypothetical protein